jgi:hypothetical protein
VWSSAKGWSAFDGAQVAAVMSEQLVAEVDRQQLAAESAALQVWKGAEDGRLLRILVRLASVLDRPDSDADPQWAETGLCHTPPRSSFQWVPLPWC